MILFIANHHNYYNKGNRKILLTYPPDDYGDMRIKAECLPDIEVGWVFPLEIREKKVILLKRRAI